MKAFNFAGPINRIGFVVFCFGVVLFSVSLLVTVESRYNGLRIASLYELLFSYQRHWWQFTFRTSLPIIFFGAWIAWLYQPTIGRLIRWIRSGI